MTKLQTNKYEIFRYILAGCIVVMVLLQLRSIFNYKAFWLDEWFILSNLKFKSYTDLFGNLDYIQQFPRVYLTLINFFAEVSNYNYFVLRFFPFAFQVSNIILIYFVVRNLVFTKRSVNSLIFVFLFLAYNTTGAYFSQIKHYTAEIFFSLIAIWQYTYINSDQIKIWSIKHILFLLALFTGMFFSYSYPIVVSPILIILTIKLFEQYKNKIQISMDSKGRCLDNVFVYRL